MHVPAVDESGVAVVDWWKRVAGERQDLARGGEEHAARSRIRAGGVKVCNETAPVLGVGQVVAGAAALAQVTGCELLLEQDPSATARRREQGRTADDSDSLSSHDCLLGFVVQSESVQEKV